MNQRPLPISEQIERLQRYIRTLRADTNRAYADTAQAHRKRLVAPFVDQLRYRRSSNAFRLLEVAEECLAELRHAHALSQAEFAPGDQVTMEVVLKGHEHPPERYVIEDVLWSKGNRYHYTVTRITKAGEFFKKGPNWMWPSPRIAIRACTLALSEEALRTCEHLRRHAQLVLEDATVSGKLDDIEKAVNERRARRGW